ncbi:MAG TPA: hypothetical protein VF081_04790 [Solirubrobacterales bacterium]
MTAKIRDRIHRKPHKKRMLIIGWLVRNELRSGFQSATDVG